MSTVLDTAKDAVRHLEHGDVLVLTVKEYNALPDEALAKLRASVAKLPQLVEKNVGILLVSEDVKVDLLPSIKRLRAFEERLKALESQAILKGGRR